MFAVLCLFAVLCGQALARPGAPEAKIVKLTPDQTEEGYKLYNEMFNSINGTALVAKNDTLDAVPRVSFTCGVQGWLSYGGYSCMYDSTAKVSRLS